MARNVVVPRLPELLRQHPGLALELSSTERRVDVIREGFDCVVRTGAVVDQSLVARPLGELRMVSCASPTYLARCGTPLSPQDLAQHQAVNYASPTSGRVAPWEWQQAGQVHQRAMAGAVTVNNAETYIACCLAGLGLIQVPAYDVREHLQCGELVEVLPGWPAPAMPMQLLYPHRRHLSRRLQAFSLWLTEVLAPCWAAGDPSQGAG
jgi:DNA-binding transcriptional LysR family regulator